MEKVIQINVKCNECYIDVQKCAHAIVESAQPDENIEESVKRLLVELNRNGLISRHVIYDSRGINTAVKDIERFAGHFIDIKI